MAKAIKHRKSLIIEIRTLDVSMSRFDKIAGSDFEPPKAGPAGGGQDSPP
jgi:hypothetical protein